jgi:2-oxoglutarate dehydrogenase E2 component (dihydrolipoamide succinyltransferase)
MPQLGETVADGTVTKWFKKVGELVEKGETLFEVSTDKVDTEIPAPVSGVVTSIVVAEGETVDVGTVLAIIGDDDATPDATPDVAAHSSSPPLAGSPSTSDGLDASKKLSPVVRKLLEQHQLNADAINATGPGGRLTREDVETYVASLERGREDRGTTPVSPVVRRLLSEHHLDASSIAGSGPDGRLTRRDVELAIEQRPGQSGGDDEVIAFSPARRLTAERMVTSKATSAHTLMVREVDFEHVEVYRRRHGAAFKEREGFSLTYLPFVALAVLDALENFPTFNASVGQNALIVHRHRNLGIAVDLDGDGLVVPVIRDADRLDLWSMARKIAELATAARSKKLTVDDLAAGTFTITNPGPYGTLMTGAVINQPQIAILATDGVKRKPVVVTSPSGEESIAIHSVGLLALTFDHRVIDGANAARFLAHLDHVLNSREWIHEA